MFKLLFLVLSTLLLSFINTAASAASFDCKLAHAAVETMICTDSAVSKLDEQLNAIYAQFRKAPGDQKAEKAIQLSWLKTRNACKDLECLQRSYATRIDELRARSANANPFVGFWEKEFPCAGATGLYEEKCKQGERDVFRLAIQVIGDRVCIIHMATAHLGNRVDEVEDLTPSMEGKAKGNVATVRFLSSWGGTGTAALRIKGNTLSWNVSTKDGGESWIPDDALLQRIPAGTYDRIPECGR